MEKGEVTVAALLDDWEDWQPRLHRFAKRTLREYGVRPDRLDANDVVQHTWLAMTTATKSIKHADRYAFKVARSAIARAGRDRRRFAQSAPTTTNEWGEANHEHKVAHEQVRNSPVEREVLRREMVHAIIEGKATLTHAQRVAVEGTVEMSMPYAKVAAQLGVSVNTLSSHRARGLNNIKSHLVRVGLYALAVFFVGSGLELVLWPTLSENSESLAAMLVIPPAAGYGHVALGRIDTQIRQLKAHSVRAGIQAFLAVGMLAGTWCIWRFGLAAEGLSPAEGLLKAAIACGCGLLLVLWVRGLGPGSVNDADVKDKPRG